MNDRMPFHTAPYSPGAAAGPLVEALSHQRCSIQSPAAVQIRYRQYQEAHKGGTGLFSVRGWSKTVWGGVQIFMFFARPHQIGDGESTQMSSVFTLFSEVGEQKLWT